MDPNAQAQTKKKRNPRYQIPLGDLSPSDRIYDTVEDDQRLLFRTHLGFYHSGGVKSLEDSQLVALALTEVCCDKGKGKVSKVVSAEQI